MSEMVQRVARVLHDILENDDDSAGGGYLRAARAAIEAMREPTTQMMAQTLVWTEHTEDSVRIARATVVAMHEVDTRARHAAVDLARDWQSMIDAALSTHLNAKEKGA